MVLAIASIVLGVSIVVIAYGVYLAGTTYDTPGLNNRIFQGCGVVLLLAGATAIGFGVINL